MRALAGSILLSLLALGACAVDHPGPGNPDPVTPTERFSIDVHPAPDEVRLAPHSTGLSGAQTQALGVFAQHWIGGDKSEITLKAPENGVDPAIVFRTVSGVRDYLVSRGVDAAKVRIVSYDAAGDVHAPVIVGYVHLVAQGAQCGRNWEDLSIERDNREYANFGCALTANVAAMIANPADVLNPRASDPSDAGRREAEIEKYRQGALTSTAKDDQADGTFSKVGQ